jgi:2-octaprenyl-6-methoxyphenol hydroxylase
MIKTDIAIIGSGITSKLTALALAKDTRKVAIYGHEDSKMNLSNLVTFFSSSSLSFLEDLGMQELINQFDKINEISCSKLENYTANGKFQINFRDEKNDLGRVIINSKLNDELDKQIKKNTNIVTANKTKITDFQHKEGESVLYLENRDTVSTKLLIIADKKSHIIKKYFKNNTIRKKLNQTSVVLDAIVETNNHAYQFFTKKGALALLPIDKNNASIIWSLENNALELEYSIENFSDEINKIFSDVIGFIKIKNLQKYKLNFEFSKRITSNSIILIGDAAHSLHPIAGQGLNLSIKDIVELKNKINKFKYLGYALDSSLALAEYENARQNDNTVYTFATNYLDQILKNRNHLVNKISNLGINAINKSSTLKKIIIKSATGR